MTSCDRIWTFIRGKKEIWILVCSVAIELVFTVSHSKCFPIYIGWRPFPIYVNCNESNSILRDIIGFLYLLSYYDQNTVIYGLFLCRCNLIFVWQNPWHHIWLDRSFKMGYKYYLSNSYVCETRNLDEIRKGKEKLVFSRR